MFSFVHTKTYSLFVESCRDFTHIAVQNLCRSISLLLFNFYFRDGKIVRITTNVMYGPHEDQSLTESYV